MVGIYAETVGITNVLLQEILLCHAGDSFEVTCGVDIVFDRVLLINCYVFTRDRPVFFRIFLGNITA